MNEGTPQIVHPMAKFFTKYVSHWILALIGLNTRIHYLTHFPMLLGSTERDERWAEGDGRARVPGPTVPDRRRHRPNHEDAEDPHAHSPPQRALHATQVPRQARGLEEEVRLEIIQGDSSGRGPGLVWLWFGCSTILPICPAASAKFPSPQAELGRRWKAQNSSQSNPVHEQMNQPVLQLRALITWRITSF